MQKRHTNRELYFKEQGQTTQKYVIPFIQEIININKKTSVMEIGCGEAGGLKPFLEMDCKRIVGIDISRSKIDNAKKFLSTNKKKSNIELLCADIFDINDIGTFDIIIARDIIEHIYDKEQLLQNTKHFLKPQGKFFLAFPPWFSPFGGHQQMLENKFVSKLPYIHIIPTFMYKFILKLFKENDTKIKNLMELKKTGLTIEWFEKILNKTNYTINKKVLYFINPHYETKFGLKPRKQLKLISSIPYLRNFFITTVFCIISKNDNQR